MMRLLVLGLAGGLLTAGGAGATTAADLCAPAADPCIVSTKRTVTDQSVLDFGSRALVIGTSGQLDVGAGTMTIRAGSLRLAPNGVLKGAGGRINVLTPGEVWIQEAGSARGRIDVSGPEGGTVSLCPVSCTELTGGGHLQLDGDLTAHSTAGFGNGGIIDVVAGTVTIGPAGYLRSTGGGEGGGGSVVVTTSGDIRVGGVISVAGGSMGGGDVTLDAGGDVVTTALINANARLGDLGDGLSVDIYAVGNVSIGGPIDGRGKGNLVGGGGYGADVSIYVGGSVAITAPIQTNGAPPDGDAGDIDVVSDWGDIVQTGVLEALSTGIEGFGGDVSLSAAGSMLLAGGITATGGLMGGSVLTDSGGATAVTGALDTSGIALPLPAGGTIDLLACALMVFPGAVVTNTGDGGTTFLRAAGQLTVGGQLLAGDFNTFEYRELALPPVIQGTASIVPAATVVLNTALAPCVVPPTTSTTTSTTTTTVVIATTTSTTIGGGGTTSTTATTSTATTTTAVAGTTSTSTVGSSSSTTSPVATTTTTRPPGTCGGGCDDGDPCTADRCDAGAGCVHEAAAGYDAVTCRLDGLALLIGATPAEELGGARTQRRLAAKVAKARRKVDAARIRPPAKARRQLRRAHRLLAGFVRGVRRGEQRGRIVPGLGARLVGLAEAAEGGIAPLLAAAS